MIEELYAIGKGVVEENEGVDRALSKYSTIMNPNLPKKVGVFDPKAMEIITVVDPRNNQEVAEKYIIYKSGAPDSPANYSPTFRPKNTGSNSAEKNINEDMNTLLAWESWPEEYKKAFEEISRHSREIAANAKDTGVEYAVISVGGHAHTEDPNILQYFIEAIVGKRIMADAVKGVCMICGKQGKVTGSALRLANLKFATPDKEVFMPIGTDGKKAFSAQFPLCEDDAKIIMVGVAFAASEVRGHLRSWITNVGSAAYEFIALPMPRVDEEKSVVEMVRQHSPEKIAAMVDVDELRQTKSKSMEDDPVLQKIYQDLLSPVEYVSIYFTEKARATTIIGSAKHIAPNTLSRLMHAREVAQMSVAKWFRGGQEYAPTKWTYNKNLFYDMVALQLSDGKHSEKEVAVALKQAIHEYIMALDGQWERAEGWLKNIITRRSGCILLDGQDAIRYLRRGVAAVLTVESMRGGVDMTVEKMVEIVKSRPDQYVAFLAGLLSAEAMYRQKREKDLKIGNEPFRKVVGNAATGDLEDFKRVLVLAVDKINQYGGSPRWVIKEYPIDVPELLSVKKDSRTEDLRFAFVLGLLVGETRFIREFEEKGGEENGEKA